MEYSPSVANPVQYELVTSHGEHFAVSIASRGSSPSELVDFGQRYWSADGLDADDNILWRLSTNTPAGDPF
jgi:hypothetical protein